MSDYEQAKDWVVLIVDDAPDNLKMAQTVLGFYGAEVHTAEHGMDGLQVLEGLDPTLILLDLSMPEMDGWTMLEEVRKIPRFVKLPVIALTAHAMTHVEDEVMEAGFDGYITKPFILDQFMQDIIRCLDKH
jgi:CheY-like chemotaxis protein